MRSLLWSLPLLLWAQVGLTQQSGFLAVIPQYPTCAQTCVSNSVTQTSCEFTNTACLCADAKLLSAVEQCVLKTCTVKQALTTKNLTATTCDAPIRYQGRKIRITNVLLAVIAVLCVVLRLFYKAVYSIGEMGWDDYCLILTICSGLPCVIVIERCLIPNGLGRDIYTVPFDHITNFGRYLYLLQILYFISVTLLKLTLLFFFLRIFPKPSVRKLLWGTVIFCTMYGLAFVILAIFQCRPIHYWWTSWDKETPGKCVHINAATWSHAIISIILDIWMLILPLYEIFQLQLSWRKKIGVSIMFCFGTFVTVVSILRLHSLVSFGKSTNPTWDQTGIIHWSDVEIQVGIICACLPALRVILVKCFPAIMGSTKQPSQPYYASGSQGANHSRSQGPRTRRIGRVPGLSKSSPASSVPPHSITYTQTFELQHTDNDELSLMRKEDFSPNAKQTASSTTSAASL